MKTRTSGNAGESVCGIFIVYKGHSHDLLVSSHCMKELFKSEHEK